MQLVWDLSPILIIFLLGQQAIAGSRRVNEPPQRRARRRRRIPAEPSSLHCRIPTDPGPNRPMKELRREGGSSSMHGRRIQELELRAVAVGATRREPEAEARRCGPGQPRPRSARALAAVLAVTMGTGVARSERSDRRRGWSSAVA
ncbi:unnamed protein product [Urochloa humidicola]